MGCMVGFMRLALILPLAGLPVLAFAADNGVVVLQREVPPRPAYREMPPSKASVVDVSPDDKVRHMVNGQGVGRELQDEDFAQISSGHLVAHDALQMLREVSGVPDAQDGNRSLGHAAAQPASTSQTIMPIVGGAVGPAVGAVAGHVGAGVKGITGTLNGLTGALSRTGAQ